MIGLGLSLMGGALAQTPEGWAADAYFLSREAKVDSGTGESIFFNEPIHDIRADENIVADFTASHRDGIDYKLIGGGLADTKQTGFQKMAATIRIYSYGEVLSNYYDYPQKKELPFFISSSAGDCQVTAPTTTARVSDLSNLKGARTLQFNYSLRAFKGFAYSSASAGEHIVLGAMSTGTGKAAVWVYNQKELIEL